MKRIIVLLLAFTLLFTAACGKEASPPISTSEESATMDEVIETTSTTINKQSQQTTNISNRQEGIEENDVGGGEIVQQKYRQCYYNITYQLSLLVDNNELKAWEEEVYAKDPNETNEMVVKLFVQHFDISKEDFEKANLESAKVIYDPNSPLPSMNPKDYINQEMYELYNADIIYTFDDQIINEYYLSGEYPFIYESDFEQAVANGEDDR